MKPDPLSGPQVIMMPLETAKNCMSMISTTPSDSRASILIRSLIFLITDTGILMPGQGRLSVRIRWGWLLGIMLSSRPVSPIMAAY